MHYRGFPRWYCSRQDDALVFFSLVWRGTMWYALHPTTRHEAEPISRLSNDQYHCGRPKAVFRDEPTDSPVLDTRNLPNACTRLPINTTLQRRRCIISLLLLASLLACVFAWISARVVRDRRDPSGVCRRRRSREGQGRRRESAAPTRSHEDQARSVDLDVAHAE